MADELATPEELAARKKRAEADRPDLSPYEALTASHDRLSDDELAERLAGHADREILLELVQRTRPAEKPESKPAVPVVPVRSTV